MRVSLRYAERLDSLVRAELESLVAQLRTVGNPQPYTPALTASDGATLSSVSASMDYTVVGDLVTCLLEVSWKVGTADATSVYATLPTRARLTRNTAFAFRTYKAGTGPDGFCQAAVAAGSTLVQLVRGDGSKWANGSSYVNWLQFQYFREQG